MVSNIENIAKIRLCTFCREEVLLEREVEDRQYKIYNGEVVCLKCSSQKKRYSDRVLDNVQKVMNVE
jgi:hypothetical protein